MVVANQPRLKKAICWKAYTYPSLTPRPGAITQQRNSARFAWSVVNNIYTLSYKNQQLKYMHQFFFSLPIQTIVKATNNNQLQGIPCLNPPQIVHKYLAPSPATSKGRLKNREEMYIRRDQRRKKQKMQCQSKMCSKPPHQLVSSPIQI